MFCPNCGTEYLAGVLRCADCDVALVGERPPEPQVEWADYVTVMTTRDHSELAMAKSLLEAARIPFFACHEEAETLLATGPVELQVTAEDAAAATELLHELIERGESDKSHSEEPQTE